ncbi:hypothetical protein BgiBS90_014842, partial [Biomphalaria glabrata]
MLLANPLVQAKHALNVNGLLRRSFGFYSYVYLGDLQDTLQTQRPPSFFTVCS